jgi:hypothetical protein
MISVPGKINIRTIPGRFGSFNVGTLECSIGSFTVKDSSIEEFEEGVYEGDFVIEKIKPNSYFSAGRMVVEIRATLSAIMIGRHTQPSPAQQESLEQDPLLEDAEGNPNHTPHIESQGSLEVPSDEAGEVDLAGLFGPLWPLGSHVKLDPTINRAVFRQQKEYLKQSGYTFEASTQSWKRGV